MKVLASSVIRSSVKGEIHGGLYLVDLKRGHVSQVLKRDNINIDWSGRGGERGLRGIEFYGDTIILTDHDKILLYDINFNLQGKYTNQYFGGCHEISRYGKKLYVTSTKRNSILTFDLEKKEFDLGFWIRSDSTDICNFNPHRKLGPIHNDVDHINSVHACEDSFYLSGLGNDKIWKVGDRWMRVYCRIEKETHNARPYKNGVIYVNTGERQVAYRPDIYKKRTYSIKIPRFRQDKMINTDLPERIAREGWGRGLCVVDKENDILASGSSPATITLYDMKKENILNRVTISRDKRNAIHGLEVWPY